MSAKNNRVAIMQHELIAGSGISPATCVQWVEESFRMKPQAVLPPKISIHPQGDDFFNTMPALLPTELGRFAVKEVHRIAGQEPAFSIKIITDNTVYRVVQTSKKLFYRHTFFCL